jgi:hypothetical protein
MFLWHYPHARALGVTQQSAPWGARTFLRGKPLQPPTTSSSNMVTYSTPYILGPLTTKTEQGASPTT